MSDEHTDACRAHADWVVATVLKKHAILLRERAESHPDLRFAAGLEDAAQLAEATARNFEWACSSKQKKRRLTP